MFGFAKHNLSITSNDLRYSKDIIRIGKVSRQWPASDQDIDSLPLSVSGMVALWDGHAVGYVFYERTNRHLELINLVVHPSCREVGIGRALLKAAEDRAMRMALRHLAMTVHEAELAAQLFLRSCGWNAIRVCKGAFRETAEPGDGYRFVRDLVPVAECVGR